MLMHKKMKFLGISSMNTIIDLCFMKMYVKDEGIAFY